MCVLTVASVYAEEQSDILRLEAAGDGAQNLA